MGLYLCIFDGDDELDGVEVGSYADFGTFRTAVATHVEEGVEGSRCPMLMLHSDCDGQWFLEEVVLLRAELATITERFMELPPEPLGGDWKPEVAKTFGLYPANLYDCFFDVDGEPLLDRLMGLAQLSVERNLPILFQ
ncbi:Imm70 family immunity protein [Rhizobium leguminosarum]|uniref:Imm70 family immunity protein n=1 Tax=Rhizobium leguminosarum TaxID=384 RepID=UPI003F9DFFB6